ncbi:MAG: hypothetical protein EPO07_06190 [Verrucomicrobia bacterium]|nr:MAG: hypothetical protein EPO07_06190 [Verrucomicrobiota bacterium]
MNDERPIEKLLRRFAKKRRDEAGAPLELHPATRRLLQSEVSRQFRKTSATEKTSVGWLKNLWPQLAWGVWIVLFVGFGAWMIFRSPDRKFAVTELVQNAPSPSEETAAAMPQAEAPAPLSPPPDAAPRVADLPGVARADKTLARDDTKLAAPPVKLDADRKRELAANRALTESDAVARQPVESVTASSGKLELAGQATGESSRRTSVDSLSVPTSAAMPAPAASGAGSVRPDFLARGGGAERLRAESSMALNEPKPTGATLAFKESADFGVNKDQTQAFGDLKTDAQSRFNYNYTNVAKSTKAMPVLANFQLEQAGKQLRVIDADGSTYTGALAIAETVAATGTFEKKGAALLTDGAKTKTPAAQPDAAPAGVPQSPGLFFRVSGTNRTLNQQVSFSGNLIAPVSQIQNWQSQNFAGAAEAQKNLKPADAKQQLVPLLQNSTISGRAQIAGGEEFEVNAVQVGK